MKHLYTKITTDLITALKSYNSPNNYSDIKSLFDLEDILYNYKNWPTIEQSYKNDIFNAQLNLFKHLLKVDNLLNSYNSINIDKIVDIDSNKIKINSEIISRNCEPKEGFSKSLWYLPCVPNINMIESLYEDDDEE